MLRGVQAAGYTDPTPIQLRAIPAVLTGRDLIASAQTGDTALARSPALRAAGKGTLPNALAVAYLPITRWVHLGLGQLHLPAGEPPADNATPLSISAAVSGPNMTVEMQIPMSTMIDLSTRLQESNILKLFGW